MKLSTLFSVAIIGLTTFASQANADTLLNDTFNQADGTSLTGTTPSPGPGSAWMNHSGTVGDMLINGNQAVVNNGAGAGSEDTHSIFAAQNSGSLSASFDVTVSAEAPITGGDYEYFAHFMEDSSFNFFSRLSIVEGTSGGDYTFGLATNSGTEEAIFGTDFTFGDTVSVILGYDFGTGLSSFSVDGSTIFSTTMNVADVLDSFALRQSNSSGDETVSIGNLVVSNGAAVPEPGSFAVLGLIGLAGLAKRRRK